MTIWPIPKSSEFGTRRTTFCTTSTYQPLSNISDSVYKIMDDCSVTEEPDEEIVYDKNGDETDDPLRIIKCCKRFSETELL